MTVTPILVVDDDPDSLEIVCTYLESAGYEVSAAEDGREAIAKMEEMHPALILLDVMMPGMDGLQVARLVKNHPAMKETRIILLTARGDFSDKQKGLQAGADDYVVKPVSLDDLRETVERNLAARQGNR